MCLRQGWYLSADFQLFLISPLIILLIYKFGRKMLSIPIGLFLMNIAYLAAITTIFNIEVPNPRGSIEYNIYFYYGTHSRCGPWLLGMLAGYFMYKNKGKVFRINPLVNALLWIASISSLALMVLIEHYLFKKPPGSINIGFHSSFITLQRNIWGLMICWILFATVQLKTGGIIRWFLSLPQWQPIARMSLSMYLVHPIYQAIYNFNSRTPMHWSFWGVVR
jgi:peptidoglycan/LPS O-acetylase OafA/YrhL